VDKLQHPGFSLFKAGGRASALYAALGAPSLPGQTALGSAYITLLRAKVASLIAGPAADLFAIAYNGDFNWYWTDGINLNALTYDYVSGAVAPSPSEAWMCQLGSAGTFGNLYQQLINGIAWQLSAADNMKLQQALTQSQAEATSVVQAYLSSYGPPTAEQMRRAQAINPLIATPLDYILLYEAGYLWAGKPSPPLGLLAMQAAANLDQLLQYAPPSAKPTIQCIPAYLAALGVSARLMEMQSLGAFTLQQIKTNLLAPSPPNGGVQLFNPPGSDFHLGYAGSVSPSQILHRIQDPGPGVTISFSATETSSTSYDISLAGQAGVAWDGDLLNISAGTSFRGDVARAPGAGSRMVCTLDYPGVASIPLAPTAWQQTSSGSTGWWYGPIVSQAWTNFLAGSSAPSGFTFGNAVPGGIKLGQAGLGYLSAVVVSRYPTITLEFTNGNYAAFSSWLPQNRAVSVSLFGFIPFASPNVDTYTATLSQSGSGFQLTLTPPVPGSSGQTVPVADQTLPVLAGQVSWVGAIGGTSAL
jgi:hypothetical protein